jgi:membrane-anchored glycerophosphoryl diester phosphodiesterase (GDPDase)
MDDRPPPADAPGAGPSQPFSGAPEVSRRERPLPLRQMGIGELIDAAIKLYRAEWKVLIGILAFVLVPLTFLQAYVTRTLPGAFTQDPGFVPTEAAQTAFISSSILSAVQLLFIQPFLTAAVARAAANIYLGEPVGVGPTYRFALTKVHSILWISLLSVLAAIVGFILLIIPAFLVFIRFMFGSTVLVVEGKKGTKALGRSWRLAKGHFWRLFGTVILAGLMAAIIASVLAIPGNLVADAVGPTGWPIRALGDSLATVLTTPFSTLIAVLLYFDLRIRKEAFDLEVMAQELPPGP